MKKYNSYLSSSVPLQEYISTVEGTINYVKAKKGQKNKLT